MAEPKRPWQHGYELDYLKRLEAYYERYNSFADSPFNSVKKNTIAESLHKGTFVQNSERANVKFTVMFDSRIAKVRSAIKMYGDVKIGVKEPGDRVITKLAWVEGHEKDAIEALQSCTGPTWLFVWAEDAAACKIAKNAGFDWVGSKITTFAEIYAVYFKDAESPLFGDSLKRAHPTRMVIEDLGIEKTKLYMTSIYSQAMDLAEEVAKLDLDYTNHYSNYNAKKAWAALSLRGYTSDPEFITKPLEMNKKWKAEHADVDFHMQDTPLRAKLPSVEKLLMLLPGDLHRVRLMRLSPNMGELRRHTDQVDSETGVEDGDVMRFHFPLVTNPGVEFTVWGVDGRPKKVHMAVGECWYIDTRKPHRAINAGTEERIHLVVDVVANNDVRELL